MGKDDSAAESFGYGPSVENSQPRALCFHDGRLHSRLLVQVRFEAPVATGFFPCRYWRVYNLKPALHAGTA